MFHFRIVSFLFCLSLAYAQNEAGEKGYRRFESTCALCHGSDGTGGEFGPNISVRLPKLDDERLTNVIQGGLPKRGMPAFPNLEGDQLKELIAFLRTLKPRESQDIRRKAVTNTGAVLEGVVLNQSNDDLELQTADKKIHLLRRAGESFREVTSETNWSSYNGDLGGNRLTKLTQIDKSNVSRVAPRWMFTMPDVSYLETTPIVMDGIMYVTSAISAMRWMPATDVCFGTSNDRRGRVVTEINRGAAVSGDGLFMVSDDAHLLRLNRLTGVLEWDTEMADWHDNYFATSAPLAVGNLVISGPAEGKVEHVDSLLLMINPQGKRSGVSGLFPLRANLVQKPGRVSLRNTAEQ